MYICTNLGKVKNFVLVKVRSFYKGKQMKLRSYKNYIFIFMGAFLLLISAFTMKVEAKENSYKPEIQGSDENTCLVFKGKCTYKFGLKMKDWKEISMKKYTRE